VRDYAVHHSCSGRFAVRKGDWVLIDDPSGGDNVEPDWFRKQRGYVDHEHPAELFNLSEDISERYNSYAEHPEIVADLTSVLETVQSSGRSHSGISPLPESELTE
jgi:arylsulfatase A